MVLPNVAQASDLVTSQADTVRGFIEQAVAKRQKAIPYVQEAVRLRARLEKCETLDTALNDTSIYGDLATAGGFSEKAKTHVSRKKIQAALRSAWAGNEDADWRDEILSRFLLTRGDSLGGSMRNLTGALAGQKFASVIRNALEATGTTYSVTCPKSNPDKIQVIEWNGKALMFDKKLPGVGNNIDVILLDTSDGHHSLAQRLKHRAAQDIIACGELKGGIDPAGADEHWKTANSALQRIRNWAADSGCTPQLFFVGAAIEVAMASEIFDQLSNGDLSSAANLNHDPQLQDLAAWLVQL